jgi:hypothetical protein
MLGEHVLFVEEEVDRLWVMERFYLRVCFLGVVLVRGQGSPRLSERLRLDFAFAVYFFEVG